MSDLGALGYRLRNVHTVYEWLKRFAFSRCLRDSTCKIETLKDSSSSSFRDELLLSGRQFIWGLYSKISEHHWICDVCHEWNKTRSRFGFDRTLQIINETWQESCCWWYKGFNVPLIFKRLSSWLFSRIRYGKIIHICLLRWLMESSGRWLFKYRFCFQSFHCTCEVVCKETCNNCSIYCCIRYPIWLYALWRIVALVLWIGCPQTRDLKRATTWSHAWS